MLIAYSRDGIHEPVSAARRRNAIPTGLSGDGAPWGTLQSQTASYSVPLISHSRGLPRGFRQNARDELRSLVDADFRQNADLITERGYPPPGAPGRVDDPHATAVSNRSRTASARCGARSCQ